MTNPILASAADFNQVYLVGDGVLLTLLFLWHTKLIRTIAKWSLPLATLVVVVMLLQGFVE